jgi:hypothetical protein
VVLAANCRGFGSPAAEIALCDFWPKIKNHKGLKNVIPFSFDSEISTIKPVFRQPLQPSKSIFRQLQYLPAWKTGF